MPETRAFDYLGQVIDTPDSHGAVDGPPGPGDHRRVVLEAIRTDQTVGPQRAGEHVRTLAALGFDAETVADALDRDVEEVEGLAIDELRRLRDMAAEVKTGTDHTDE